ncbi:MAG: lipopolysaccharide biosynthesis protein [Phocaeicola sp.]
MSNSANSKRIAKNTALLYCRTLFTMIVSLFTSRIVLRELGVVDYGIYSVVGGVVAMFSFLNSAMSSATQRYFSFALGKGDREEMRRLFSITLNIHFILGFIIVLLAETIGLWFLNTQLNIPSDKMVAANWVYQSTIVTFFLGVISVPYNALIVSHERMNIYAYVGIFEVLAKLVIIYLLVLAPDNKLIWFAAMGMSVYIFIRIFYGYYCSKNFMESRYSWIWDKEKSIEMISYAGWNLFGNLAAVGFSQGITMLLNIFFGPVLNAANGVAQQVNGAITGFVGNFQAALNPQIVKSYAAGNKDYMQTLVFQGSRLSFYLLLLLMLPVLFHTELLLTWWLKEYPDYSVILTQLVLINAMVNSLSGTLMTSAQATGAIRRYQAIVGSILLLNVPISYIFLKLGSEPWAVMAIMIVISIVATISRLIILEKLGVLRMIDFLKRVVFNVVSISAVVVLICYFLLPLIQLPEVLSFFVRCTIIELIALTTIWFVGVNKDEREFIISKLQPLVKRFNRAQ